MTTTGQYVRHLYITIPQASWGTSYNYTHNLNDGRGSGYAPNVYYVNKAYVLAGGTYFPIEPGIAKVAGVNSAVVGVVVGEETAGAPALTAAIAAKVGVIPTSMIIEVEVRMAHSIEIGSAATGEESINLPAAIGLPISLYNYSISATPYIIYVRSTGNDSNDGLTVATALLTPQAAFNRVMQSGPWFRNVLIDNGPGTFVAPQVEGLDFRAGARFAWIGVSGVTTTALATSTSAGAATITQPRACNFYRLTPDQAWSAAPTAAMIGRTLRIRSADQTLVTYATIGNVSTKQTPAGAGDPDCYIDLTNVAFGGTPAWITAAGTTYTILDGASTDVNATVATGPCYIANVTGAIGSFLQPEQTLEHQHCIGNICFTGAVTFDNAQRVALHGCRLESTLFYARGTTGGYANLAVPAVAPLSYVFTYPVWTRLGYTASGTANSWGGMGFYVSGTFNTNTSFAMYAGLVTGSGIAIGGAGGTLYPTQSNNHTFNTCSIHNVAGYSIETDRFVGWIGLRQVRFTGALRFTDGNVNAGRTERITWAPRALAVNDAPALGISTIAPLHPLIALYNGTLVADLANMEGIITNGRLFFFSGLAKGMLSGSSNTGAGNVFYTTAGGWLVLHGNSQVMATSTNITFPSTTGAEEDVVVIDNSYLFSGGGSTWRKPTADVPARRFAQIYGNSTWEHGNQNGGDRIVVGDGIGGGIDCGGGSAIEIGDGSSVFAGQVSIRNTNGNGMALSNQSKFIGGTTSTLNVDYIIGSAANVVLGASAADPGANPLVPITRNDFTAAGAITATEQLCFFYVI